MFIPSVSSYISHKLFPIILPIIFLTLAYFHFTSNIPIVFALNTFINLNNPQTTKTFNGIEICKTTNSASSILLKPKQCVNFKQNPVLICINHINKLKYIQKR